MPRRSGPGTTIPGGDLAAPIPRPSRDYEWKIANRPYGDTEEKAQREALRQREAEERARARESGEQVNLGKAGEQWAKAIGHISGESPVQSDKGWSSWNSNSSYHQSSPSAPWSRQGHQRSQVDGKQFDSANPWANFQPSTVSSSSSWAQPSTVSSSSSWARKSDWSSNSNGQASHGQASSSSRGGRSGGHNNESYSGGGGNRDSVRYTTAEEKARRHEEWLREAEQRRRQREAQGQQQQQQQQVLRPYPSNKQQHQPQQELIKEPPAEVSFEFPHTGMDDDTLKGRCESLAEKVKNGEVAARLSVIDLAGNDLTDTGVQSLVEFLKSNSVLVKEVCLQANLRMEHPMALAELLRDPVAGLAGGALRTLRLSSSGISCEACWRLLEVCCMAKPRPPLAIFLDDELGRLDLVVAEAEKRGLLVQRMNIAPGVEPPSRTDMQADLVFYIPQVLQ